MNESDIRDGLQRLASTSAASPARLDIDKMLRVGRKRIRRRRVGALHVSFAAAALVVLSAVGIVRLAADEFGGPAQRGSVNMEIPEAGASSSNPLWVVPGGDPQQSTGTRPVHPGDGPQATLVQGHVAF